MCIRDSVWAWTGVAAACAAVAIAAAIWPSPAPEQTAKRPQESFSAVRKPQDSVSTVQKPTPEVGFVTPLRVSPRSAPTPVVAAAPTRETEILVPPDQLIGIRQLMASVRRGADLQVAPPQTLIDPVTGELIAPKLIEIPLITVTPLPGDPEGRSGGRENR